MAKDYIELIGEFYPTAKATVVGNSSDYNNINWETTAISKEELDLAYLTRIKTLKILDFSEKARQEVTMGFYSNALGSPYYYDSEPEDQLNLIGAVATAQNIPYSCRASTQGYQIVNVGGAKAGTNATGFANTTTTYNAEVIIDGESTFVSVKGQDAQTFSALMTQIQSDLQLTVPNALCELVNGNIKITSPMYGSASTVSIVNANLFNNLTGYVAIETAVDGIDGANNGKEYQTHTHAQMQLVLNDGATVKLVALQKFSVKRSQVEAAIDEAAVNAIVW